jgi:hypothetical protein
VKTYRFGKHPAKNDYRTFRFKKYLTDRLEAPPPSFDVLAQVYEKLKISDPKILFPCDNNCQYGDCTIAALAHALTTFRGLVGKKKIMTEKSVVKLYFKLTGGIDSGLYGLDVLNYWRKHAVAGDEILAFARVDRRNHTDVMQAIRLFGGIYTGFQVQEHCVEDFDAGRPWTPGPLTNEGHMVHTVAYDAEGVTVLTWGNIQKANWEWFDECVDEVYAILPPEAKKPGFAPGFDFKQLEADLKEVATEV